MNSNGKDSDFVTSCYRLGGFRDPVFNGSYSFNTGKVRQLSPQDYIVLIIVLTSTFVIGAHHAWRNRKSLTLEQFLLAFRRVSNIPAGISFAASIVSGITILGTFSEVYTNTTMYTWIICGLLLAGAATAHIFHPLFYRLQVVTSHEYLELRFDKNVRALSAFLNVITQLGHNSLNMYAPSLALQEVTGLSLWGSIFIMTFICVVITSVGGMRSVIEADLFQLFVIFLSAFVVLGRAIQVTGSWGSVWESNKRSHRILFDEMRWDSGIRHSIWSTTVGSFLNYLCFIAPSQTFFQKTVCCNELKDVKIAVYIAVLSYIAVVILNILSALCIGAFYENCDPIHGKLVQTGTQVLPLFVMDTMPDYTGLAGLFAAGLLIASLSSNTSGFNAVTTIIMEDFILNYKSTDISPPKAKKMARIIFILYAVLVLVGAYAASKVKNILQATHMVVGILTSSVLGAFTLGMFFPKANTKGAISGIIGSFIIMVIVQTLTTTTRYDDVRPLRCTSNCNPTIFHNFTTPADVQPTKIHLSYMWLSLMGVACCLLIGMLVTLITGPQNPSGLHRNLYVLVFDDVFPFYYLPESVRKWFRYDAQTQNGRIRLGTFSRSFIIADQQTPETEKRESLEYESQSGFKSDDSISTPVDQPTM